MELPFILDSTALIITVFLIQSLKLLALFIAFKFVSIERNKKVLLPLYTVFIILIYPIFSSYNLSRIEWMPKLALNYYDDRYNLSTFQEFSIFYYEKISVTISILQWFIIGLVLKMISSLSQKEYNLRLFIPIFNFISLFQFFIKQARTNIQKITAFLFIFSALLFSTYIIIAPLLFYFEIDIYEWYMNILYGYSEENHVQKSYIYWFDTFNHINATVPFLASLLSLPKVIELKRSVN